MESVGQGLALPLTEDDTIKSCLHVYTGRQEGRMFMAREAIDDQVSHLRCALLVFCVYQTG